MPEKILKYVDPIKKEGFIILLYVDVSYVSVINRFKESSIGIIVMRT